MNWERLLRLQALVVAKRKLLLPNLMLLEE